MTNSKMTQRILKVKSALICLLTMLIWACVQPPYYTEHKIIDNDTWYRLDTVVVKVPNAPKDIRKDLTIGVRYTTKYEYKDFCIGIRLLDNKKLIKTDTLKFNFYSDKDIPEGNGAFYKEIQKKSSEISIKKDHNYEIQIYHIMRLDPILGVSNLTVNIE
ncbi:MAG: gliding motility lipoprotein GldH [Bacteroidaceae bacterium]|nr:gliding motility lipoprotein GldH [Bacteroidaceae bacterium]